MSIIKSIKQVLGLSGTASENHFWDGSVPNQLSLRRGTPDDPGAELIKALGDVLSFPSQGQSLAADGYVKLPGGLIVQWGATPIISAGGAITVNFPTAFPNEALNAVVTGIGGTQSPSAVGGQVRSLDATSIGIGNTGSTDIVFNYIAIGH